VQYFGVDLFLTYRKVKIMTIKWLKKFISELEFDDGFVCIAKRDDHFDNEGKEVGVSRDPKDVIVGEQKDMKGKKVKCLIIRY
jgi:hypothetical protein